MSDNKGWQQLIKKFKTVEDTENIHLHFINEKRAERYLTNLHTMLKEMAAFQLNQKVRENGEQISIKHTLNNDDR